MVSPGPGVVQMDPVGFWIYARDFRRAADVLPNKSAFSPVAYYLHCHSIELSLKAFLLRRGISLRVLRNRPLGHDLIALLSESPRDCRRLQWLRGWSHGQTDTVFPRGA